MTDLSEKAIALIMWERALREVDFALYLRTKRWNSFSEFMHDKNRVEEEKAWKEYVASRSVLDGWVDWSGLCRKYLAARGWEPLP